ncbi:MAG: hypothetical protein ACRDZ9_10405 [Acidimicrobiales bacterium]
MGRASSAKKVARASRAGGRPGTSRNLGWAAFLAVVVALGAFLVVVSVIQNAPAQTTPPRVGDHWHAAYGIYVCDGFTPPLEDAETDVSGLHTHGDGLIHIHPFSARYSGEQANLGTWGDTVGVELSDTSLEVPGRERLENGDDCDGEPGRVQVKVWEGAAATEGRLLDGDPADFAPSDANLVTIAFAPEGTDLPKPPSTGTVPGDVEGSVPVAPAPPPGGPGSTTPP